MLSTTTMQLAACSRLMGFARQHTLYPYGVKTALVTKKIVLTLRLSLRRGDSPVAMQCFVLSFTVVTWRMSLKQVSLQEAHTVVPMLNLAVLAI